jgi:PIN domain nuclease of toxin-antitoxin system
MLNLDTHILLHALGDEVTESERTILSRDTWSISAIVLWEVAKLAQLGRIELDIESTGFHRALSHIHIWPIELSICAQSTQLDFQSDPADELIAATSIVWKIPLVTRDQRILSSKLVPFAN